MLIKSLATIVISISSFIIVIGQAQNAKNDTSAKTASGIPIEKPRDMPFPGGVDLQFLVKELARDIDLNVLFDPESRLEGRKVRIEVKNVTTAEALNLLLLQEGLYSEEVGPKTILVASRLRGTSIPQLGLGITPLTQQLAQYFGVEGGILVNQVRRDSIGFKAGLRAGDVIVAIDDQPVRGALVVVRALGNKSEGEFKLRIARDRREETVSISTVASTASSTTPSDLEKMKDYLLTSAAQDFHDHQPPFPAKFRNVRLGHAGDTTKSGSWRLCGEFLPSDEKAEWTGFATVKTSGYEQYIGSNVPYCNDEKLAWDTGDLSADLKAKLDSGKKKK